VRKREGEVLLEELLDVWASDVLSLRDFGDLDNLVILSVLVRSVSPAEYAYLNRPETSTMSGGHILVERLDGVCAGHLAVLLVHVVRAGARVISNPDTEVLDLAWVLLGDLCSGR
jgi:hypothetical protein